jgi:NAD(P)-dependent dehydrogenase (short-subunit alcohol dehydrogenase family)
LGFEVNVKGSLIVTQAFLKYASPNATLINISSGAAHLPYLAGFSGCAGSKLAFAKIVEYVQCERIGLRLFSLQPGAVETDMATKGEVVPRHDIGAFPCLGSAGLSFLIISGLPAAFSVWLASPEADFLKGRFIWANWDVAELK